MNAAWEWIVCEKIDKRKQSVQLWSYGSILGNYVCVLLDIIFFYAERKIYEPTHALFYEWILQMLIKILLIKIILCQRISSHWKYKDELDTICAVQRGHIALQTKSNV